MTRLKIWLAALGAAVVAILAALGQARKAGRQDAQDERNAETIRRTEAGRDAVARGRDGGGSPDERVRKNDGLW